MKTNSHFNHTSPVQFHEHVTDLHESKKETTWQHAHLVLRILCMSYHNPLAKKIMPLKASQNHRWGKSDDTKLNELINQGAINPDDRSRDAIKAIHAHWAHKPYKTFAELIRKKLRDICQGQILEGARGKSFEVSFF